MHRRLQHLLQQGSEQYSNSISWKLDDLLQTMPWNSLNLPLQSITVGVHLAFLAVYFLLHLRSSFRVQWPVSDAVSTAPRLIIRHSGLPWRAACFCCLFLLSLHLGLLLFTTYSDWAHWSPEREGTIIVLLAAWIAMCREVFLVRKEGRQSFPVILRAWWISSFALAVASLSLEIGVFTGPSSVPWAAWVDLAAFPARVVLFWAGLRGTTGAQLEPELNGLKEALLDTRSEGSGAVEENVSTYRTAGVISHVTFSWLTPLLEIGARKPLQLGDIPLEAEQDRADSVFQRLTTVWDALKAKKHGQDPSIYLVLIKTFWKKIVVSSWLALIVVLVLFVGPVTIEYFVEYLGGEQHFPYEGYILPLCLFLSKLAENVFTRLQYYEVQRLGVQVRMALSALVFRKGLRLSSMAKQGHTSGEIVNYMTVDVRRVAEFAFYLSDIWIIPLQVIIALAVLYKVVGLATVATLGATILFAAANAPIGKMQKRFQDQVMTAKDERMKATSESLRNMRILKLQAWEVRHMEKLESLRKVEYGCLRKVLGTRALVTFIYYSVPVFVAVVTFGTCVLMGIPLTAGKVFAALATFRTLQAPMIMVPDLIQVAATALVSVGRLEGLFNEKELRPDAVEHLAGQSTNMAVEVEGGIFSWDESSEKPILTGVELHVGKGERVAVCGTVGSGKSSLLSAILGEMVKLGGSVKVSGQTGYVAQSAWIQSGKIQDNILFGRPMDRVKYEKVIRACALLEDLESFPFGDQTEIGERGLNLSGGQKQRVQIARALYQDVGIYLLDDPFSAVDAHTGSTLFKECILGAMATKTVIYVTHQVEFLPAADLILVMRDGEIVQAGKYEDLLQVGTDFNLLVTAHNNAIDFVDGSEGVDEVVFEEDAHAQDAPDLRDDESTDNTKKEGSEGKARRLPSLNRVGGGSGVPTVAPQPVKQSQLVQEEERETGKVAATVYWSYLTGYRNGALLPIILLCQILYQVFSVSSSWWMAWATPATAMDEANTSTTQLISVFIGLSITSAFFIGVRAVLSSIVGLGIAQNFFRKMLHSIFRAPMSFFDSTPAGRILSRASSDQSTLDQDFSQRVSGFVNHAIGVLTIVTVLVLVTWEVLLVFVPVVLIAFWMEKFYMAGSRELSRLSGILQSPIIHHYSESVAGAATVRGFGQQERFMETNLKALDQHARPYLSQIAATEWLAFRFELLTNVVFAFSLVLLLCLPEGAIDPSMAGLAVTYGLTLNMIASWSLWHFCEMENQVISVERIKQYCSIPGEAPLVIDNSRPPKEWPSSGTVELQDLKVRYNDTSPLVLHGISCIFPSGQKVGVVGRTGSGKSTLIQALFRVVEPAAGKILIDGTDIASIGLHDLRVKLSIIPQDPTLFEGDLRMNLDPLGAYSDDVLWETLRKCHLVEAVQAKEEKLDAAVHENGENWSVGQRQLICLGRALLKRTKILVLDEATASVDTATDSLIQQTIRTEFAECTVITVAHRIPTVIDSDLVLVLNQGRLAELDSPVNLLQDTSSMFAKLVHEYTARSQSTSDLRALGHEG